MRIGIDLGGTKIEAALIDSIGALRWRKRVATPKGDYDGTVSAVAELVVRALEVGGSNASIGIGIPGSISPATGLVRNANSTWLNGRPLATDLEQAVEREIRFANDADCFALSEAVDGAGQGASSVFGAILGTGVGAGLVLGGRLIEGTNRIAGEWGHNPLPAPRRKHECWCGNMNCIETYLSGPALERAYRSNRSVPAQEIVRRAALGQKRAVFVLERYAADLARALAGVVNIFDPEVIVLGGGLSQIEFLYDRVPALWGKWIFSDVVTTRLLPPYYSDSSGVRGAAWLWPPSAGAS